MGFFDEYPYTNWHNVNLDWVLERVKEWGQMVEANDQAFKDLEEANESFKEYVTNYLQDLDIQEQIDDKLDRMFEDGTLGEYLQPYVSPVVTEWLEENITTPENVIIDSSLTIFGAAADAGATGQNLKQLKIDIDSIPHGLTEYAKQSLLTCFRNVGWTTDNGNNLYYDLYDNLYEGKNVQSITAIYNPNGAIIYTDNQLDELRQYIIVTARYNNGNIREITNYTLEGVLNVGSNVITIKYANKTATITVTAVDFYDIWHWSSTYTGIGQLFRINGASIAAGAALNNIGIFLRDYEIPSNIKRGFNTLHGKAPVILESNKTVKTIYYPVPVPKTAVKATCRVTPNTQRLAVYLYTYNPDSSSLTPYTCINTIAWNVGEQILTFTAAENLFISFNCSVDSSFRPYTEEPEMEIIYE